MFPKKTYTCTVLYCAVQCMIEKMKKYFFSKTKDKKIDYMYTCMYSKWFILKLKTISMPFS